jgi:hypothetical protein
MSSEFQFDVCLNHCSRDKAVVRPLAERLRHDGWKAWFDAAPVKGSQAQFFCIGQSGL